MDDTLNQQRQRRLEEAANQYRRGQYQIEVNPAPEALPEFLVSFPVDLIARSPLENVAVVVRTHAELGDPALRQLAEVIRDHSGWRLDVFFYGSPEPGVSEPPSPNLSRPEIETTLALARLQWEQEDIAGAFEQLWVGQMSLLALLHPEVAADSSSLRIRQCVTDGLISREQYRVLWKALQLRQQPGDKEASERELIPPLFDLATDLLAQVASLTVSASAAS